MARKGSERAVGPYRHGNKWRVIYITGDARETVAYESEREAIQKRDEWNRLSSARTVDDAVRDYLEFLRIEGPRGVPLRESSVVTAGYRLKAFLKPDGRSLWTLTPKEAERLYTKRRDTAKGDTHRGELAVVTSFAEWCVGKGWFDTNPFDEVKPRGALSTGKTTLKVDEARKFYALCLKEASVPSIAAGVALLMGMRASEIANLKIDDLDDGGTVLIIRRGKTANAARQLRIPSSLLLAAAELARGKRPEEQLFTGLTRYSLHHHVARLCRAAGVRVVCPHGLRGSAATIAVDLGVDLANVARGMGHSTPNVTRRHYLAPGTEQSANARATEERVVQGSQATPHVPVAVTEPHVEPLRPGNGMGMVLTESLPTGNGPDQDELN